VGRGYIALCTALFSVRILFSSDLFGLATIIGRLRRRMLQGPAQRGTQSQQAGKVLHNPEQASRERL